MDILRQNDKTLNGNALWLMQEFYGLSVFLHGLKF